jgi:hypothetical protein
MSAPECLGPVALRVEVESIGRERRYPRCELFGTAAGTSLPGGERPYARRQWNARNRR